MAEKNEKITELEALALYWNDSPMSNKFDQEP